MTTKKSSKPKTTKPGSVQDETVQDRSGQYRYTVKELGDSLRANDGRVFITARKLGISYQAIYERIKNHPELADIIEQSRGEIIDLAESGLKKKITEGDTTAMIYVTKTLGKSRGYIERQEVEQSGSLKVTVNYSDDKEG